MAETELKSSWWTPERTQALSFALGGGAQAVMGKHQDTWQAMLGKQMQGVARTQQFGALLAKMLSPGQKISVDEKGTTVKTPLEIEGAAPAAAPGAAPTPQVAAPTVIGGSPGSELSTLSGALGGIDTRQEPTPQEQLGFLLAR